MFLLNPWNLIKAACHLDLNEKVTLFYMLGLLLFTFLFVKAFETES